MGNSCDVVVLDFLNALYRYSFRDTERSKHVLSKSPDYLSVVFPVALSDQLAV